MNSVGVYDVFCRTWYEDRQAVVLIIVADGLEPARKSSEEFMTHASITWLVVCNTV